MGIAPSRPVLPESLVADGGSTIARNLGLEGREVTEEALDRALSAADPISGGRLAGPISRAAIPGFDPDVLGPSGAGQVVVTPRDPMS